MHGKDVGAAAAGLSVVPALTGGCSARSKKTATTASTPATASFAPTSSVTVGSQYLAAIAPVDKRRDEYEASNGTRARATIAPPFAASLRAFEAVAAQWSTSGRTATGLQTMIRYDQMVATEVSANDLTLSNVDRDDAAHAAVRADLGLPPAS